MHASWQTLSGHASRHPKLSRARRPSTHTFTFIGKRTSRPAKSPLSQSAFSQTRRMLGLQIPSSATSQRMSTRKAGAGALVFLRAQYRRAYLLAPPCSHASFSMASTSWRNGSPENSSSGQAPLVDASSNAIFAWCKIIRYSAKFSGAFHSSLSRCPYLSPTAFADFPAITIGYFSNSPVPPAIRCKVGRCQTPRFDFPPR